jgi:hypothetical protein
VLSKLGAHSRLEAVAYAVREGLVDTGGWQREHRPVAMHEHRPVAMHEQRAVGI